MLKRLSLYCDNLLNRDKYLSRLSDRVLYFKDIDAVPSKRVIDEQVDFSGDSSFTVPEIDASDFTIDFLKKSIRENGCGIVRNFFEPNEVKTMKAYVDHSFAVNGNPDSRLHKYLSKSLDVKPVLEKTRQNIKEKLKVNTTYANTAMYGAKLAQSLAKNETFLMVKTPILAEKFLQIFERKKLKTLLHDYFGNEPCVSVYKWVVRKSQPPAAPIDFHQDGAFMGDEISSLNCWIPLTDCGAGYDVHGLDIVPVRMMNAFEKGSGMLNWTISANAVTEQHTQTAIVTPTFKKGDLLFFDHLLVHRSQSIPNGTQPRYAIETWFFDSVNFPKNQMPIKW